MASECRRIDLDPAYDVQRASGQVFDEIRAQSPDAEVALRGTKRYVPRFGRRPADAATPKEQPSFRPDATYLITGGLGGIGLATARWLVSRGARHLVLVGRSATLRNGARDHRGAPAEPAPGRGAGLRRERSGQVARLLEDLRAHLPPLRGIFHGAGVLDDAIVARNDWARFERVFAPKVHGAWNLHA